MVAYRMGSAWDAAASANGFNYTFGHTFSADVALLGMSMLNITILSHGFAVDHANFYACKRTQGFCTPFVGANPGLVTHAPAQKSHDGSERFTIDLTPGAWTLIMHYRVYVDGGIRCDFAKGVTVDVEGQRDSNAVSHDS